MPYLLDTNTCIAYINQSSPVLSKHLLSQSPDDIFICDITKYELYYRVYESAGSVENFKVLDVMFEEFESLPFDGNAAMICGSIRPALKSKGSPIGAYDLQIAAIAISNNLTLISHNTKEFQRLPGLALVDWFQKRS